MLCAQWAHRAPVTPESFREAPPPPRLPSLDPKSITANLCPLLGYQTERLHFESAFLLLACLFFIFFLLCDPILFMVMFMLNEHLGNRTLSSQIWLFPVVVANHCCMGQGHGGFRLITVQTQQRQTPQGLP